MKIKVLKGYALKGECAVGKEFAWWASKMGITTEEDYINNRITEDNAILLIFKKPTYYYFITNPTEAMTLAYQLATL